jgi:hypothetical protein
MTATYDPTTDIVDRVAGLIPGSSAYVTRHRRDKVAVALNSAMKRFLIRTWPT